MAEGIVEEEKTEIPADVYGLEILTYLPAKNLQKLQTVSNDWLQLISSHYFVSLHRSRACASRFRVLIKLSYGMIDYNNYDNQDMKRIPFPPQFGKFAGSYIKFMGSSDGLIYMSDETLGTRGGDGVLFNPSTGKYLQLLPPKLYKIFCYWFGKSVDGEYTLVMGLINRPRPNYELQVYKLTSSGLKHIHSIFFDIDYRVHLHPICERGIFVNGVVYWPVVWRINGQSSYSILAYDIYENKQWEMSPPSAQCGDFRLGVNVDGCLLAILKNMNTDHVFEVWIRKESWTNIANIDVLKNDIKYTKVMSPLGFSSGGDLILDADKKYLMMYNFNTNVATVLIEYPFVIDVYDAIMCADTLVSPSISD